MGIIYCYHDMLAWGPELAANIQRLNGSAQMMTHAVQVEDEVGTGAFIHVSNRERQYTQELAAEIGEKHNVLMVPSAREIALHDDFNAQYAEFGQWMPTTFVLHSLEHAQQHINDLEYPVISLPTRSVVQNRRVLENPEQAFLEAVHLFGENGLQLADGSTQKGYAIWQPMARHIGVRWQVFMLGKRYAVITEIPTGADPSVPGAEFTMVDTMKAGYTALLDYVHRFVTDNDLDWACVEVLPYESGQDGMSQPFVVGYAVSWPMAWFEFGGMIFESGDGKAWDSTGIPAVKIWNVVAEWMMGKLGV